MDVSMIKTWWKNHIPPLTQILAVYGIVVLVVYGWTIYWYLWKLPSWLYFLTISEMAVIFAYAVSINFLESLIVIALAILLSLLLPVKWFRDVFLSRGTAFVITLMVLLMRYLGIITFVQDIPKSMNYLAPLGILILAVIVFLAGWIALVRRALEEIANRAVIFLYIFIPLSIISLLVVLIRNILV